MDQTIDFVSNASGTTVTIPMQDFRGEFKHEVKVGIHNEGDADLVVAVQYYDNDTAAWVDCDSGTVVKKANQVYRGYLCEGNDLRIHLTGDTYGTIHLFELIRETSRTYRPASPLTQDMA